MKRTLILAGAISAIAVAGAASAETLRWANAGDVLTLDPYAHTESFTSSFLHHIYEPLVRRDAELIRTGACNVMGRDRTNPCSLYIARGRHLP